MRRAFPVYLLIFLVLGLSGGFAWMTRNPDAEILRQAESWPYVGSVALWFNEAYRGNRSTASGQARRRTSGAGQSVAAEAPPRSEPVTVPRSYRRQVWVLGGMELKARPSPDAATVHTFDNPIRAGRIERRGDWYHVDYNGRVGWLLLPDYDEDAEVPYGEEPEPVRPLPARAPDEEGLAAARKYLRGRERLLTLGPYNLYTDIPDDRLIARLDAVAGNLETVYAERYGLRPAGDAAEAVVMFQSDIAYRLVQQRTERLAGLNAAGHNAEGLAVLYSGGRSRAAVTATVIHELVHFLNRRAIGPHLPPWIDEGIADDLALARVGDDGRIHPRELSGARQQRGNHWRVGGALASLLHLRDAATAGEMPAVPDLMSVEWESFVRTPKIQLHYAAASFWIRYLLEGEGGRHAPGLRAFLAAVAAGEPPAAETLEKHLAEDWTTLDSGFRDWIGSQAARVEPAAPPESPAER